MILIAKMFSFKSIKQLVKIGMIAMPNVQETGNAILYIVDTPPAVLQQINQMPCGR